MGSQWSEPGPAQGSPQQLDALKKLQDLDIVLIRSLVQFTGAQVDYQVAKSIGLATQSKVMQLNHSVERWDRIGIITVPEWKSEADKELFSLDTVMVTEATANGVQTHSLADVCKGAMDVSVRTVQFFARLEDDPATGKKTVTRKEKERVRSEYLLKWFHTVGPILNRPYESILAKFPAMFEHIRKELKAAEATKEQEQAMNDFFVKHDKDNNGLDVDELMNLFGDLTTYNQLMNTFSHIEITEMVREFEGHDSSGQRRRISKEAFLAKWRRSMARTVDARRQPRPLVSGAFVSEVYQRLGFLEQSPAHYYRPIDFTKQSGRFFSRKGPLEAGLRKLLLGDEIVIQRT